MPNLIKCFGVDKKGWGFENELLVRYVFQWSCHTSVSVSVLYLFRQKSYD